MTLPSPVRSSLPRRLSTSARATSSLLRPPPTERVLPTAPEWAYGPTPRAVPLRKPPNFAPAVQRYSALLPDTCDELVIAQFGVQARDAASLSSSAFAAWAGHALTLPSAPSTSDHARFVDAQGYTHHVLTGYWLAGFDAFRAATEAWWAAPERLAAGEPGVYREVVRVPPERFESIYWLDYPGGLSADAGVTLYPTPYCGYYGAMRDRLVVDDVLEGAPVARGPGPARGRWRVTPAHNTAVIRTAHTWSAMDAAQKADYDAKLAPPLARGMQFLEEHPDACLSLRWATSTDALGEPVQEKHATGYFASLGQMEHWSERHRTHAAIFSAAVGRYKFYGEKNQLRTWHEVAVLPGDREQLFEYVGCHAGTGLLPYFEAQGEAA
ncbi:hypothetical protein Q8F55_006711 [Vanrija albida]|uniref:Phenylacetaldoxime dehydratase n=1 Tax=Vanrija albida TaxID=181172 RepID=A0ABR3PY02_9TREE